MRRRREDLTPEQNRGVAIIISLGLALWLLCAYVHSLPSQPKGRNHPEAIRTFEKYGHLVR